MQMLLINFSENFIAIRFINPENIIATPVPRNQSVSVLNSSIGKTKLICSIPKRIIIKESMVCIFENILNKGVLF